MNFLSAIQILRGNQKRIRGLFTQLGAVDLRAHEMVSGVRDELCTEIAIYAQLEEEILYPEVEDNLSPEGQALIDRGREELEELRHRSIQLKELSPGDQVFMERLMELQEVWESHIDEEQSTLLNEAEQVLGSKLQELGERMTSRREQLLEGTRFRPSSGDSVQNPHGGEQMRKGA